jgi:uncharacterized protein YndB with AHSA1/START domain
MITVERTCTIAAPITRVWEVLADFDQLAAWADNADHTSWLDEPLPDGQMVGRARRVQAGRMVLIERITIWEPPARLAYDLAGLPPVVKSAVNEWSLCADPGNGERTTVTLASHIDCGPRPPQQLLARVVGRRLGAASTTMLDGLTQRVAAQTTAQPAATVTFGPARCDSSTETIEGMQP